jgi:hypothetical protein
MSTTHTCAALCFGAATLMLFAASSAAAQVASPSPAPATNGTGNQTGEIDKTIEHSGKHYRLLIQNGGGTITEVESSMPVFMVVNGQGTKMPVPQSSGLVFADLMKEFGVGVAAPGGAPAVAPQGSAPGAPGALAGATAGGNAPHPGWDAASRTIMMPNGGSVTYIDNEHLRAVVPEFGGAKTVVQLDYHAHALDVNGNQRSSFGSRITQPMTRGVGGSLSGSGVTLSLVDANGQESRPFYDTAANLAGGSGPIAKAQPIIGFVLDALNQPDVPKEVKDSTVHESLRKNNRGLAPTKH